MKKIDFCSPKGSKKFSRLFNLSKDAYNLTHENLSLCSVGFGMYKGSFDHKGRKNYQNLIYNFIKSGVNVFDCARKYRHGYSEIDFGIVFQNLIKQKFISRDQIFVSSKAGLINFYQDKKKILTANEFAKYRGLKKSDIKNNLFCASKKFLEQEIDISLKNLRLKTLDNYYLHNPAFLEGNKNNYKDYYNVFETFEKAVQEKKIKSYGISSWTGFRRYSNSSFYIDLKKMLRIAQDVAGEKHNFKNIQVPISIYMPFAVTCYKFDKNKKLINFCYKNKINIFSSASLYEGRIEEFFNLLNIFNFLNSKRNHNHSINNDILINKISLPDSDNSILQLFNILQKISKNRNKLSIKFGKNIYKDSLNFVRSNSFITTSLFGVENFKQLDENLGILKMPKFSKKKLLKIWKNLS